MASTSKRIVVVAVDGSTCSSVAFDWAVNSVCNPEDDLHILHVRQPTAALVPHDFTVTGENSDYYSAVEDLLTKKSKDLLVGLVKKAQAGGLEHIHPVSLAGDAREEIVAYLADVHASLLVVGSRGLGFMRRAMLGSVSAYVSKHAPCAVLIVKETSRTKKQPDVTMTGVKQEGDSAPAATA